MALPDNLRSGLLPSEAEYLATSSVEINIVPLMRIDRVRLLDGVYGPLRPPTQARVPLWMALSLKKRKRCSIVCPEWLHVDSLKAMHREETMHDEFAPMPLHYVTIAKVLLESASDDVPNSDEVRGLLKSIREARQSKVLSGVEAINTEHLQMENISLGEVTELRAFLSTAFDHLHAVQRAGETDEADTNTFEQQDRQFSYTIKPAGNGEATPVRETPFVGRTTRTDAGESAPVQTSSNAQARGEASLNEESMNNMDLF